MYCSECDSIMQWRCTNQETGLAKYKCPTCGKVIETIDDYKPLVVEKFEPKYHYFKNGRFIVRKEIDGKFEYIGSYKDKETADKVVEKMKEYDWDKSMLPRVYDELGMHQVNRLWVAA